LKKDPLKGGPSYTAMAQNRPDNFYTPKYALEPLIKHISTNKVIWEAAAGVEGVMVKNLREFGYEAHGSTIENIDNLPYGIKGNMDFLKYKPIWFHNKYMIVTNPPFTLKDKFLERCYSYYNNEGIPFALLMPITALEGKKRMALYAKYGLQLIMPPGRINFITPIRKLSEGNGSSAFFYSVWFTMGLNLPKDINFETQWNKA
jgi:hypothetical protein